MKRVFKNAEEVAHIWASQSQDEGRCSNASFEFNRHRNVFRSYRTVVAKVIGDYVIIERHNYSATTNGHYSALVWAFRNVKQVLRVRSVDSDLDHSKSRTQAEIDGLLDKASVARTKRDDYLAQAQDIADQYNTYVGLMNGKAKDRIKLDIAGFTPEKRAAAVKAAADKAKRERAAALKKREVEIAESIKVWREGGWAYLPYGIPTMLRLRSLSASSQVSSDLEATLGEPVLERVVQTSRNASIPVEDAKRLWPIILRVKGGDKDYEPGMPLGSYRLTQIKTSGDIVVGCHNIAFSEIEMIAQQLGLLEEVAA